MSAEVDKSSVVLDFPSLRVFESYIEALKEGFYRGVGKPKTQLEIQAIVQDPDKYLVSLNDQTPGTFKTPNGIAFNKVPFEILWLSSHDMFLGEVSFRLEENEFHRSFAGHIGYGIRPAAEGQGLGKLALKLIIKRAAQKGFKELHITCDDANAASREIIKKNGGQYMYTRPDDYGYNEQVEHYIVPVAHEL